MLKFTASLLTFAATNADKIEKHQARLTDLKHKIAHCTNPAQKAKMQAEATETDTMIAALNDLQDKVENRVNHAQWPASRDYYLHEGMGEY